MKLSAEENLNLMVDVAAMSHLGLVRENNEDSHNIVIFDSEDINDNFVDGSMVLGSHGALYSVADGMGGGPAGKEASSKSIQIIENFLRKQVLSNNNKDPKDLLVNAVQSANNEIYFQSITDRRRSGMGTTFAAIWLIGSHCFMSHVGDSRIYLLRSHELSQLTEDHSYQNMIRDMKGEDLQEPLSPEQKSLISRAIGVRRTLPVDVDQIDVTSGDRILICTDGLTDLVSDETIRRILLSRKRPREACRDLIREALHSGGSDNVTVMTVDCGSLQGPTVLPGLCEHTETRKGLAARSITGAIRLFLGLLRLFFLLIVGFLPHGLVRIAAATHQYFSSKKKEPLQTKEHDLLNE